MYDNNEWDEPVGYDDIRFKKRRFAFITWIIFALNIFVYLVEGHLSGNYTQINPQVIATLGGVFANHLTVIQPWRLFTATWLHFSIIHIGSNMLFLLMAGWLLERRFGHLRFLVIYLISGMVGNAAAFLLSKPGTLSAGASTALFGIMLAGVSLRWTTQDDAVARPLLTMFILNIVTDLGSVGISVVGHLGGAVAGLILGTVLRPRDLERWYTNILIETLVAILLGMAICAALVR